MAFLLMCITIFIMFFQPASVWPVLTPYQPLKYSAIIALAAYVFDRKKSTQNVLSVDINRYFIAFVAAQVISAAFIWFGGGIEEFNLWLRIGIVYFIITKLVVNKERAKYTVIMIVVAIGYLSYYSISRFVVDFMPGMRAGGFGWYENANDLSVILVTTIPLSILLANTAKRAIFRYIYLCVSALFAFNILFTGSRNGLLGLLVVGILSIIFSVRYSRAIRTISLVLLVFSIFTVGLKAVIDRRDLASNLTGDDSSENRIEQWRAGAKMFITHPIFGVGPGGFMDDVSDYGGIRGLAPHNTLIQVFAESGLVGGILFLLFSFKPIYDLWPIMVKEENSSEEVIYYKFVAVSLLGFWICAFFTNRYQFYILYILVALSVAVRENIIRKKGSIPVGGKKTHEPYVKSYKKLSLVDNSTVSS